MQTEKKILLSADNWPQLPMLPVSWGEVFDKLTILEIKAIKLDDPVQNKNVVREKNEILKIIGDLTQYPEALSTYVIELQVINQALWEIEEGKRDCERRQCFDSHFIELARQVYLRNDQRAAVKRRINILLRSSITEEKSYPQQESTS